MNTWFVYLVDILLLSIVQLFSSREVVVKQLNIHTYIHTYILTYIHTYIFTYVCLILIMFVLLGWADWCSVSHISLQPNITGYPIARDYSFSDGWEDFSSGIPYFYMTFKDSEIQDLSVSCNIDVCGLQASERCYMPLCYNFHFLFMTKFILLCLKLD